MCMKYECIDCGKSIEGREEELCYFDTDRCLDCASKVFGRCGVCQAFIEQTQTYCEHCLEKGWGILEKESEYDAYKETK